MESCCRNSMSLSDFSNSSVCLMTWNRSISADCYSNQNVKKRFSTDQHSWKTDHRIEISVNTLETLCWGPTVMYFSSWLLLFGTECTRHSWIIYWDISSQISSPKMVESFLSPIDTSEENCRPLISFGCQDTWIFQHFSIHTVPNRCVCSVLRTMSSLL